VEGARKEVPEEVIMESNARMVEPSVTGQSNAEDDEYRMPTVLP